MKEYEYICRSCGSLLTLTEWQEDNPTCSVCDSVMSRNWSAGIIFKGSGFYRNDK